MRFSRKLYYFAIFMVLLAVLTPETDARRKIMRGRKTVTRTYFRPKILPAWAVIVLVGFGEMLIGGILYVLMKKFILDRPMEGNYVVAAQHSVRSPSTFS